MDSSNVRKTRVCLFGTSAKKKCAEQFPLPLPNTHSAPRERKRGREESDTSQSSSTEGEGPPVPPAGVAEDRLAGSQTDRQKLIPVNK